MLTQDGGTLTTQSGDGLRTQADQVPGLLAQGGLRLTTQDGTFLEAQVLLPSGALSASYTMPYSMVYDAVLTMPITYVLGQVYQFPYAVTMDSVVVFPITYQTEASYTLPYGMNAVTATSVAMPYAHMEALDATFNTPYAMLDTTATEALFVMRYAHLDASARSVRTTAFTVQYAGRNIRVLSATWGLSTGDVYWSGTLRLADIGDYGLVAQGGSVVVTIDGNSFSFVVDSKNIQRQGSSAPALSVLIVSQKTTDVQTWDLGTTTARDAVETLVGETVTWDLVDWAIPSGRAVFHQANAAEAAQSVARAAGGTLEALPDGGHRVRHLYPVPTNLWADESPTNTLTDSVDILSIKESHRSEPFVDAVAVRGFLPDQGVLTLQVDSRVDGLNYGNTSPRAGRTLHLLTHHTPDVTVTGAESTAGSIVRGPDQAYLDEEYLTFQGSATTKLTTPATSLESYEWIGESLGALTLAADRMTVTAATEGYAIARCVTTRVAESWALAIPASTSWGGSYPVYIQSEGVSSDDPLDADVVCFRGTGGTPATDISDPLLAGTVVKLERGRSVIDGGSEMLHVSMITTCKPGIKPGDMVVVHDKLHGPSWNGQVTTVNHTVIANAATSSLEILRYVGTD